MVAVAATEVAAGAQHDMCTSCVLNHVRLTFHKTILLFQLACVWPGLGKWREREGGREEGVCA